MFDNLLKPSWKSKSVNKRLSAIESMNGKSSGDQEILQQLINDSDTSVCIAAIQKITLDEALFKLSENHVELNVRKEADKRIDQLVADGTFDDQQKISHFSKQYPQLAWRAAAYAPDDSSRIEALKNLSWDHFAEVLRVTVYTDSRQQIAEKLSKLSELESAKKILRGKDKKAERIIRNKIDEIKSIERVQASNLSAVEKLLEEAEYLANHEWLPDFMARVAGHRIRWNQLDFEIQSDLKERYQTLRSTIDVRFEEQKVLEESLEQQKELLAKIETFVQVVAGRDITNSINSLNETLAKQEEFKSLWQQLAIKLPEDSVTQSSYDQMALALDSAAQLGSRAAEIFQQTNDPELPDTANGEESGEQPGESVKQVSAALKKLKWPSVFGVLKLELALLDQLEIWRNAEKAAVQEFEQKLAELHKKISSVFRFSDSGNLPRAKQLYLRIENKVSQYTGKERKKLDERLEEARKTMGDMLDWKNFATEPKYIEFCESMEILISSQQHADKIFGQIKSLQQQWKEVGNSDVSNQYWPRFKEAADKAYLPCAELFEQRRINKQANLEKRQVFVDQMQILLESTNWDIEPNYKLAQDKARKINDDFLKIKEVEQGAGRKQWRIFSKYKDQIYAKLDVVYLANIELKRLLVKQATDLAEAEAREENLNILKTLQTKWKQVGITRRNADQKAWIEFKKQGDIAYNQYQSLRQTQKHEVDQQLEAYRALNKDIQTLAKTAIDLALAEQQFSELQDKYAALSVLGAQVPDKLTQDIERDHRRACDQFGNTRSKIVNSRHRLKIDALREKAKLCTLLESMNGSPEVTELEEISRQWEKIELFDKDLSRRINSRRDATQQPIDQDEIAIQRKMLCIKLEITNGKESPEQDKALRMQYQLDQMNKSGLGQLGSNDESHLENLEIEWLCLPGAEPATQKKLDQRFQLALKTG